jgi:hypothetical protein
MSILGWLIVIAAAITAFVFYRRSVATPPAGTAAPPAGSTPPDRAIALAAAIVAVGLAIYLFSAAPPSAASLKPTYTEHFDTEPKRWVFNNPGQVGWDPQGKRLLAKMKVGEGWYGVVPMDWNGDVFRAEWDITILKRDADPDNNGPGAVAAVGMYDGSISNIDDTDHVGGGSILAVFGDTVRLRISDVNLLVQSAKGGKVEVGKPYHAILTYDRHGNFATLNVAEKEGGKVIADLRIEDLHDLTSGIAWFGVSMKGFSRNKTKTARGATSAGLFIDAAIDDVTYAQP